MTLSVPQQLVGTYKLLNRLFRAVPPNYKLLLLSPLCIGCAAAAQLGGIGLVIPVLNGLITPGHYESLRQSTVVGRLIEHMPFDPTNRNLFIALMCLILACVYLENALQFAGRMFSTKVSQGLVCSVQSKTFERLMRLNKAFYDNQKTGRLSTLITSVPVDIGRLIDSLTNVFIAGAMATAFFVGMIFLSWQITMFAAVLLPIIHVVSTRLSKMTKHSASSALETITHLSGSFLDVLTNMPLVQLSGTEELEFRKFNARAERIRAIQVSLANKLHFAPRVVDVINATGSVAIACGSIFIYFRFSSNSVGSFLVYFLCLRRFATHLGWLVECWMKTVSYFPSVEATLALFEDYQEFVIRSGNKEFGRVEREIRFENVSFAYDNHNVILKDVSFRAKQGSITALVGPTGAGKTTLVHLLARLYEHQSGVIKLDDVDIREFTLKSLRRRIGMVSQGTLVMNDSVMANLVYGLDGPEFTNEKVVEAVKKAQLYDFIIGLPNGFDTMMGEHGVRLSGGECQRLSIARALLRDPDILILDEATSALDSETEVLVQRGIEQIVRGRTIFIIAHRLSTVRNADWVIVLENGRISEQGPPEELFSQEGRFYQLSTLQNVLY